MHSLGILVLSPEMLKGSRIIADISNHSDTLILVKKPVHLLNDSQLWQIQQIKNDFSIN